LCAIVLGQKNGKFTQFSVRGSNSTTAYGINDSGQIVGTFTDAAGDHGFLRDASGNIQTFDIFAGNTQARSINNAGVIAGIDFVRQPDGTFSTFSVGAQETVDRKFDGRGRRRCVSFVR
jgi:probable HAF family extracellular repeat protein